MAQAAALSGIGLLYMGTNNRLIAEFLLAEMSRRPSSDRCLDREAYTLAAGISLGMVTLGAGCKGGGGATLSDLHLDQRLHRFVTGGKYSEHWVKDASNRAMGDTAASNESARCSRVAEGEYINTDLTAPGATLALGLMFLKSNDTAAARRLRLPDTPALLDHVRPDFLALRVTARSLILWDSVEATTAWVESQLPDFIVEHWSLLGAPPLSPQADERVRAAERGVHVRLHARRRPLRGRTLHADL